MKKIFLFIAIAAVTSISVAFTFSGNETPKNSIETMNIYDIKIQKLEGGELNLGDFKGKKMLIVNVASKCGYTDQYAELQELYDLNSDDLMVVGVPCNQFGGQEPGSADEIATFCQKNYGVTFQMTEKVDVKGEDQHPLYQWLTQKSLNGLEDSKVKWNFNKYLVDENGALIGVYSSGTKPMSEDITSKL